DGEETGHEVELNEANNWQGNFTDLNVNNDGKAIAYTVEEVKVEGYQSFVTGPPKDGFVITNTYEPERIDIKGTKTWDDADNQDGKRPIERTVKLLANGEEKEIITVTDADD